MTKLAPTDKVVRETLATHRGVPLVIEVHGRYITIRPKGKRNGSTNLDIADEYERGLLQDARLAVSR